MDSGVNNFVDDKYATASSVWLQVSRQGTAKDILHIGLHIYIYVYFLEFYTSWNSVSLELLLLFSLLSIFKIVIYVKFPWHQFRETNIHITFRANWKAAMCVIAKRNALYYTIIFDFLYLILIALILHACIWISCYLALKISLKYWIIQGWSSLEFDTEISSLVDENFSRNVIII